ncbi:hypothetical protein FRC06_010131 [Ceratobasidium sp. 370]|nr:hypothetical protein FRC06_010131 [Ceratobasidium sp. 370]
MVPTSSVASPRLPTVPVDPELSRWLGVEATWLREVAQAQEYSEVHLAWLEHFQAALDPKLKLAKKRRRYVKDPSTPLNSLHHKQSDMLHSALPSDPTDYEEIESQFMEAARSASLKQYAIESGVPELNPHAGASTANDKLPSETVHMVRACPPTPGVEYNAYGCVTAYSKGKTRAD